MKNKTVPDVLNVGLGTRENKSWQYYRDKIGR